MIWDSFKISKSPKFWQMLLGIPISYPENMSAILGAMDDFWTATAFRPRWDSRGKKQYCSIVWHWHGRRSLACSALSSSIHSVSHPMGWVDIYKRSIFPSFGCSCGGTHLFGCHPQRPHYQYPPAVEMKRVRIGSPQINRYGGSNDNNDDGHVCMPYCMLT